MENSAYTRVLIVLLLLVATLKGGKVHKEEEFKLAFAKTNSDLHFGYNLDKGTYLSTINLKESNKFAEEPVRLESKISSEN